MLFKGNVNKQAKPNVKANELLQEYFRVASGTVYMPFCPYTTESTNITAGLQKLVSLDRDFVVTGDVLIFCEQVVNGKSELVKPDKWPTELYTKTGVAENTGRMSNNKKPKKRNKTWHNSFELYYNRHDTSAKIAAPIAHKSPINNIIIDFRSTPCHSLEMRP